MRAVALALLCACLLPTCGGLPRYETPEERDAGRPLAQVQQRRTGELTWRPGRLESTPEGVLLEFTLVNGTSREYLSIMLRLVLRDGARRLATVRWPAGPLTAGGERRVRAHLPSPGFVPEAADVELIWAQE